MGMENVEKAIARIMADKVYTSAEFKRERDTFHALCKDLERTEVKKWLNQILEILLAERAKSLQETENEKLSVLIQKHEQLIPTVQKTAVMVDLYWKCYAYGDELKPHIEFLDGIMLSSTREIAPSCVENVDELIERQEKSLTQLDSKRGVVVDLIAKGKVTLEHPDKPKFLEGNVKRIQEGWDDTKSKAQERLKLLIDTKEAWVGYAANNETIASEFEVAEEEIKKVKKRYSLEDALSDLKLRQDLFKKSDDTITGLFNTINANFTCMSITLPEDKKKIVAKEIAAVQAKLEVTGRFKSAVTQIDEFCTALVNFDNSLKAIDEWMGKATAELNDIKEASGAMLPEDRVARTMDLQEDIASKIEIIKKNAEVEKGLLPQGDKVDKDASTEGLVKPSSLDEVKALHSRVMTCDKTSAQYLKVLNAANDAAQKMTTHAEADAEVAALRARYDKVKTTGDEWVKKVDVLLKEWTLLDNTVTELNSWVAKDKSSEGENQFSLEKMESTLGELKNIFKEKEKLVEGL